MAKVIKMTPELKEECRKAFMAEFEKALTSAKMTDGKINFTKAFGTIDCKAKVYFTELAWLKMTALLKEFSKEVAWHATAFRVPNDEGKNEYLIQDILVYPQTVTAASVDMDTEKYTQWLMDNFDDERFNNIHAQMHSHVNMGVTPSSVDLAHQEEILDMLKSDDFYIFMIWNKSHNVNIRIFDMQKNVMFDTTDVTWGVIDGDYGLTSFVEEAKKIVVDRTPTYTAGQYSGYGANQGYGRSPYYTPQTTGPYNPVGAGTSTKTGTAGTGGNTTNGKGKKKSNKKKTKFVGKNACEENKQLKIVTPNGEDFDMSDPFGYHEGPFQIT